MKLVIRFDDQSASYAHGVEFGRMLAKMERGESVVSNFGFPVREENIPTIISACKYLGYDYSMQESIAEGWIEFIATKHLIVN